ncbi:SDR family NAD(P)-dependent oxidoreductase [Candidatus Poriferisocius sp.]|uniref:SDR family NAD(P)-dependent oxidoreductase n=1 Tax=Candidatus Poriferisocius sp. TaxID=3101276 RepID=UPI003B01A030
MDTVPGELAGKVALVTGAARGLGAEVVRRMVVAGARVTAADRRVEDGTAIAVAAGARFFELDVTDAEQWRAAVDSAAGTGDGGKLDILVNNAGIIRVAPILQCEPAEFRKVVETNLVGTFLGIRAAAPLMAAGGGGSIINLCSPGGFEGTVGMPAYTSSKWGIRGLTRTAALELADSGIRVNTVVPGPMRTAMTRRRGWDDEDYARHYGATVPLRRMAEFGEVADLVIWLASDRASYCTGGDYAADGGLGAGKPAVVPPDQM